MPGSILALFDVGSSVHRALACYSRLTVAYLKLYATSVFVCQDIQICTNRPAKQTSFISYIILTIIAVQHIHHVSEMLLECKKAAHSLNVARATAIMGSI